MNELHRQTGDLRNAIADLKRTVLVRKEQSNIAVEGQKCIDNLDKKLVKAISYKVKQQEKFCSSKATKHHVELLTETWNSMFATEQISNLSISFICITCGCFKIDVPFYDELNKTFTCGLCYEKQQT